MNTGPRGAADPTRQAPLLGVQDGPQYKAKVDTRHGKRTCFEAGTGAGRKPLVARFGGIPLKRQKKAVIDDRPAVPATPARS